ncbi:hypothetical protein KR074_011042 [Drosophila pseudoananassae]|nr:hypothetical protein KR074_011042 [Drosophila pseudoananassae]
MNSTILDLFQGLPADPVRLPLYRPLPATLIVSVYLLVVLKLGPQFMASRKPYNVRKAMLVYNLFQVLMNSTLFVMAFYYMFVKQSYDLRCMILPSDHPDKGLERVLSYAYFINKILDLMDTLFFVLRKSYKQITLLHVYHHALMVMATPIVVHFYGSGGQYSTMGILNVFVHAVMYAYYFVAALHPQMKNKLWWKKYITKLQIVQFLILFFQAILTVWLNPTCNVPMPLQYLQVAVSTSMMVMFGNFYYQAYVKVKSKPE